MVAEGDLGDLVWHGAFPCSARFAGLSTFRPRALLSLAFMMVRRVLGKMEGFQQ
jgi:hypothetical protein